MESFFIAVFTRVPNCNAIATQRNFAIFALLLIYASMALININFESSASETIDDPRRPRLLDEVNQDDGEIDVPGQLVSRAGELIEAIERNHSVRLLGVQNY